MSADPSRVEVVLPGVRYAVTIGTGLLHRLDQLVRLPARTERVAVVSAGVPAQRYAPVVAGALGRTGRRAELIELPDGEPHKTLATLEQCCREFARIPLGRDDLVVAVGGGVIGDLAGFAAAVWHRGIPVVQVPTTLLAQVDAAVGGKTAVDLPEGKNLLGAFHQPSAVVADLDPLRTLPERERRAGLAEVLKYGFIADPELLAILEDAPAAAVGCAPELAGELVRRSVTVKAGLVGADERESGQRALLNYGHTVGHAVEALGGYQAYRHGEAVGLGMIFAARLGERLGISEAGLADRTVAALAGLGLPTGLPSLDPARVWEVLRRDKKARRGVRFVVCSRPGQARLVDPPDPALVDEVLGSLARGPGRPAVRTR
jgi:3-dehydroquinate synthase